jgi:hypothetical protein
MIMRVGFGAVVALAMPLIMGAEAMAQGQGGSGNQVPLRFGAQAAKLERSTAAKAKPLRDVFKPSRTGRVPQDRATKPDRVKVPDRAELPPKPDRSTAPRRPKVPDRADVPPKRDRPTRPDRPNRPDSADGSPKPDRPGRRPDPTDQTKPPRPRLPPIVLLPPSLPERPVELDKPPRAPSSIEVQRPQAPEAGPRPQRPPVAVLPLMPKSPQIVGSAPPALPPAAVPALPASGPAPITPPLIAASVGGEALSNEVVFAVAETAAQGLEDQIAQRAGLRIVERVSSSLVGLRIVRCQGQMQRRRLVDALTAVRSDPRALDVQANFIYRPSQSSQPARRGLQYTFARLDLDEVDGDTRGRGVRVAVIDSGVDLAHPDLDQASIERYDALGGITSDSGSHGTSIAGIIAARGTIRGVAPGATLLSIRAFPSERAPSQVTTTFVLIKALEWAIAQRVGVVNLSLAGPRDPLLQKAIEAVAGKGVLLVAAAGNNGDKAPPAYPAAYRQVIAVTAIDEQDKLYQKANHGSYIAVAAPGVDVLVAIDGKAHALQSGTSFAAAHISGVLALMLERAPSLSSDNARRALTETAVDLGSPGRDDAFGAGRTSAAAALRAIGK